MSRRLCLFALGVLLWSAGCGGGGGSGGGPAPGGVLPTSVPTFTPSPAPTPTPTSVPTPTPAPTGTSSSGSWEITVYYTAVESFHSGSPMQVVGCPTINCSNGNTVLGTWPSDFVQAVQDEGAGRITSTPAGMYLNWSGNTGYWLDTAARDDRGQPLIPLVSAAADPSIAFGTRFKLTSCGTDSVDHTPSDPAVCANYEAQTWTVYDRFTQGAVGQHVDLYIGEENTTNFTSQPQIIDNTGATLMFLTGSSSVHRQSFPARIRVRGRPARHP